VHWTPPVRVFDETWGFWREIQHNGVWYATAYNDGDVAVGFLMSPDAKTWQNGVADHRLGGRRPERGGVAVLRRFMERRALLGLGQVLACHDELTAGILEPVRTVQALIELPAAIPRPCRAVA